MNRMRGTVNKFSRCLMLMATVSVVCLYPTPLNAQTAWQRVAGWFGIKPGVGRASGRSRGAAVRDPDLCPPTPDHLTALVPNRNEAILTSKDYPSFWFYMPYQLIPEPTELKPTKFLLKFVLQDDGFNDIYSAVFDTSDMAEATRPGLVSLQLMAEDAALEAGNTYNWYFLIYCDDEEQVYEPAFVHGRIRRESLPQNFSISDDPLELQTQFAAYAESNFWYEAFDILALNAWVNSNNPQLADGWDRTLEAIELDHLDNEPFIGRYQVFNAVE